MTHEEWREWELCWWWDVLRTSEYLKSVYRTLTDEYWFYRALLEQPPKWMGNGAYPARLRREEL